MSRHRMTAQQAEVAERVMEQECALRRHLVVHLSGAHAYGFPSHDSDLDLKSVHIEDTAALLGLGDVRLTFNRAEILDGVEVDYSSNELRICVSGLLKGDGNMLERVCSRDPVRADPLLEGLQALVPSALSRRFHRHYNGFAFGQAKLLREAEAPSAKKLLYVLRTAVTGAHLLLERECEPDLTTLHARYGFVEVPELAELKHSAERGTLDEAWAGRVEGLLQRAFDLLDRARVASPLPEEPAGAAELDAWMLDVRRAAF